MGMPIESALALAEEAKVQGHLNKYPQACIALAAEVERLSLQLKAMNDNPQTKPIDPTPGEAGISQDHPNPLPEQEQGD